MLLRHRFAATCFALLLTAGPSLAQTAPAAPAQGSAAQPSASHLAIAREVAVTSGLTRSFDAILPQFADRIRQQAVSRPEVVKDLNEVLTALEPEMELQKQQMIGTAARVFAVHLSEAELKDIANFFKSPSGQRYVNTQPQVLDDMVRDMQTWTQEVAEYIMVRVRAELGKRGHQLQ